MIVRVDLLATNTRVTGEAMGTPVNARKLVGHGPPSEEGRNLSSALLATAGISWADLEIDARGLPPGLLISAFFSGFLESVHENRPALLRKAKRVKWHLSFQFQEENVARWTHDFRPLDG
ncbi:hypothetical protein [Sorangium sp. So ce1335]|uniref:hypothetical protein n=1 Tax=Sorangium sp. So ce1335 TaxID=3133335 RepID=UPI003F624FBE